MKEVSLTDYIRWFSDNHVLESLDSDWNGVIVAPINDDNYLIRLRRCKKNESN